MLTDTNSDLYSTWSDYILEPPVRSAFWCLIGMAACSKQIRCRTARQGQVRAVRFYDSNELQRFAFIVNRRSLLFYFMPAVTRSGEYSPTVLAEEFPSFKEPQPEHWTVKLENVADVERLSPFLAEGV